LKIAAQESAIATPNDPRTSAEVIRPGPEAAEESTSLKTHPDILETEGVVWQPVFTFNADNRYHVRDFLPLHDRAFVTDAYRAILRREPDVVGLEGYLAQLRSGMSKAEILACLQYSAEGRLAGTRVAGLRFPYAMHKLGQWPVIGPWMGRLAAIWYMQDTERERRAFENTLIAYVMQEQSASVESLRKIGQALGELSEDQMVTRQTAAAKADRDALESIQVVLDVLKSKILGVEALMARKAEKNEMETILESIRGQLQNLQGNKAGRVELAELNSIKADTAQLQLLKAERAEVEELRAIKADKVEIAHLQSLKADKVELDEILAAAGNLRRSHGELRDMSEEFIHALEGKSDRRELSALTSSLVKLAQTQVCKDDLAALEQSIREIVEHRIKEIEKPARNSA
jgi:hypothetical protein